MADHFLAAEHHTAGDGNLVGFISIPGAWAMVCDQVSTADDFSYPDIHRHADDRLFGVSGQRGNGVSPAGSAVGVLFYIRSCRVRAREREARRTKAAT